MSFTGPRPIPVEEAKKVPKKYDRKFSVLLGLSSPWVVEGTDHSPFDRMMELDFEYVEKKIDTYDFIIVIKMIRLLIKLVFNTTTT